MDPTLITKIVAAGAMGVSIFCIFRVYDLLKKEQEKENPRPIFIRSIYVFMGFAVVMTLLSLGIEYARHFMDIEKKPTEDLIGKLKAIAAKNYFSVNQNGNPEPIELPNGEETYVLSKAFPNNIFEKSPLTLKKTEGEKHLAVKNNNGNEIVFGYISDNDLKSKTEVFFANLFDKKEEEPLKPRELLSLGVLYAPPATARMIQNNMQEDKLLANDYLTKLVSLKDSEKSVQEKAIKLLTQPELMSKLDSSQYEVLIGALASGNIRTAPWGLYELAQVYLSRSWQSWNTNATADIAKYKEFLKKYTAYYDAQPWVQDQTKYPQEFVWYEDARKVP